MTDAVAQRGDEARSLGLAFMAVASGSADVIAFLMLGQVFASAMTGNAAILGIMISQGNGVGAAQPATALIGFVAGAALAAALFNPADKTKSPLGMLRSLFLIEIVCLSGFAVTWHLAGHPAGGAVHYGQILLCALPMGIQGIAAKRINAPGLNTIVFTSTLVTIVLAITERLLGRADSPALRLATRRQVAVFGAYAGGALFAGLLVWGDLALLPWIPAAAVVLALASFELAYRQPEPTP